MDIGCSRSVASSGNASEAVSDVEITDGVQHARAISFFTVAGGKIERLVEYWPEPYAPLPNRAYLVELMGIDVSTSEASR